MMRSGLRLVLACLSLVGVPAAAQGPLHVDITQGEASPLPIAIPEVSSGPMLGAPNAGDIGVALSHIIRDDLLSAGLYRLVTVGERFSVDQEVVFAPFMRAGAQALVIGRAQAADEGRLTYECLLYDVFGGRVEASQKIVVSMAEWRRAAHKCADMVFSVTTGDPGHFDTRLLFVADDGQPPARGAHLVAADFDGANATALTRGRQLVAMPDFSPDSHRLVFMSYEEMQPKLLVADTRSGQATSLNIPQGVPSAPRFSPDGRSVIFSLARDGDADIYTIDLASGSVRQLTNTAGADTSPSYASDGMSIVFESDRSGEQQIYVMAADGSRQRRISFGTGAYGSPSWSPRNDMIAYTHIESGQLRVGVMKPDGSGRRIITNGPHDEDPSWALSGRAIAFQRTNAGGSRSMLWITDLTGKAQHPVRTQGSASDPAWSGKRP